MSYTIEEIDQMIFDAALKYGYTERTAKYVIAQSRLETGNYKSKVKETDNNLFGMSYAGKPGTTKGSIKPPKERDKKCKSTGICANVNYYARYKTLQDSINDRLKRYDSITINNVTPQMLKDSTSAAQYAKLLKRRGYYTASENEYATALTNISSVLNVKKKISRGFINFNNFISYLFNQGSF